MALLDFEFDDHRSQKNHISHVQLKDQYCQTFYDKLTYIFIEMPRFTKKEEELENHFDKWLYFLKHLEDIDAIPEILKEDVFLKGFEIARIANFDEKELSDYEASLKNYRDLKGVIDTAFEEGGKIGFEEGFDKGEKVGLEKGEKIGIDKMVRQIAVVMKKQGESLEKISNYTGLSTEDIEKL